MFRFTIRDMLWLTVVVAMGAAWWAQQERLQKGVVEWKHRATAAKGVLVRHGWEVNWDGSATEFTNGTQEIICPLPPDEGRYVWHVRRDSATSRDAELNP